MSHCIKRNTKVVVILLAVLVLVGWLLAIQDVADLPVIYITPDRTVAGCVVDGKRYDDITTCGEHMKGRYHVEYVGYSK